MALRQIRLVPDEILYKVSRKVDKIDERLLGIIDDMIETVHAAPGYGIAAVQIGILRRIVVIDIGDGPMILINPEIVETEGEEVDVEGCLSVPGYQGDVTRPAAVTVSYMDEKGEMQTITAAGLFKKALCHEIDHLDGIVYTDIAIRVYEIPIGNDEDDEDFEEEGHGSSHNHSDAHEDGTGIRQEASGKEELSEPAEKQ